MEISHPRNHAGASSNQETTTFNDLSEDVVLCLMSKLSLRDVLNFSVVSKRWIHVPSCLEKIDFDSNMFKDGIQPCPELKDAFIKGVNQFLKYYTKLRSMVDTPYSLCELFICVCLCRESCGDLDAWISLAFRNGVKDLFVIMECEHHPETQVVRPEDEKYNFSWKLLDKSPIVLESLHLQSCIFECHLTSVWTSLVNLQLSDTVVTQQDMDTIRHCFPNLEMITLRWCKVPAKLTFSGGPLSFLGVMYCKNLKEIEVLDAGMLQDFKYRGLNVALNLINPHQLTKITFSILNSQGVDYVFQNLRRDFPAMRSLSIYSDSRAPSPLSHLYGRMYSFLHLEELKLYSHPNSGFSIQTIREVLKACPVLRRLEMVPSCTVDGVNGSDSTVDHPHKCLEFIKISGFCGGPGNVELAKFMVQVSEALVHLVIKRKVEACCYFYSGHSETWHGQQEPQVIHETLRNLIKVGDLMFF